MSKTAVLIMGAWLVASAGLACRRASPPGSVASTGGGAGGSAGAGGAAGARGAGATGAGPGGGGSGGAGSIGTGGEAAAGWLQDSRVWTPVPGGDDCGLLVADVSQPGGPTPQSWSACGTGCTQASALTLPGDAAVLGSASAAAVIGGDVYLRLTSGGSQYNLMAVTRLSDGGLLAAVQQRQNFASCTPLASARAPLLLPFIDTGQVVIAGQVRPGDKTVIWSPLQSGVPLVTRVFSNDPGWGMQFDDGTIRVLMPPTDTTLRTIDQGSLPTYQGAGLLDRMVWSSAEPGIDAEVVKAYTPAGGVQILASQDTDDNTVALSDTAVAWIGTTGPQRHDGSYQTAQLFWAPWPNPLGPVSIQPGPLLPATNNLLSLATSGDFAATIGCTNTIDSCQLLVVQLSTGKLQQIHHRPGSVFLDVMAVSTSDILLSEVDNPGAPELTQQIQRLVRLDLGHLADLALAW